MDDIVATNVRTTQAAEGVPRWRWTTFELLRLAELGAFADTDRFELIGGEIVPMSPVGRRHRVLTELILATWRQRLPADVSILQNEQIDLDDATFTEPDLWLKPSKILGPDARGPDVLLLIEIADSSLKRDLTLKALLYARHGVPEYWVIDADSLQTTVHTEPSMVGYGRTIVVPSDGVLRSTLLTNLELSLKALT